MAKTDYKRVQSLRVGDLLRLFRDRYGPTLPDDEAGQEDLFELLVAVSVGANGPERMQHHAETMAPWFPQRELDEKIAEINSLPLYMRKIKPRILGDRQSVTNAQRERLGLWTILPCDRTKEQMAEQRKAKKRARDRERRRRQGKRTRAEYLAKHSLSRKQPWKAEGISRASWYRQNRETSVRQVKSLVVSADLSHVSQASSLNGHHEVGVSERQRQGVVGQRNGKSEVLARGLRDVSADLSHLTVMSS
jgi:hypothetical protein